MTGFSGIPMGGKGLRAPTPKKKGIFDKNIDF